LVPDNIFRRDLPVQKSKKPHFLCLILPIKLFLTKSQTPECPAQIVLSVSGNIDSFKKLVRGSGNYRAKIWFTSLRYSNDIPFADVLN